MTTDDTEEIHELITFDGLSAARLAVELSAGDDYHWVGLADPAGRLRGVHRSMRWGSHLLLKGVFVEKSARSSGAVLRLAFALRELARDAGCVGIAAWVEPSKPETALARVLRLRTDGSLLHRFEVRLADGGEAGPGAGRPPNSGVLTRRAVGAAPGAPLVADLLRADETGEKVAHWVIDGRRAVLSACPVWTVGQLDRVVSAVRDLAADVDAVEFPLPAGDLAAALVLAGAGARRLSRTPIRLGRYDFAVRRPVPC
ncbi:hypothetical protein Q5425_35895 [Amycolatopsis sp. A133]|uniref:hypothetical protein n=1 Tax=Amycolatopsis sp. A133 TaxID=3064472 RepID=UPI0027FB9849|nr:hypothetical protein [Amycolatopsis sp. A133]MDQ7809140.1 hypothetical protein [Amycolatopsis sp. A133]